MERKYLMDKNIKKIISELTLEEKAGLCSGADFWHTKAVERLGIPNVLLSDGPHGMRMQADKCDHLGIADSETAVCFPAACATACSFDRELLGEMGSDLGNECRASGISVLLGPAVNIKRSPLCGRNFEYFSEDPYLTGELASAYINGVQKHHIGTSIKHFAVNNQEFRRNTISAEVDERTLREIYLAGFENAVKNAQPKTVMCSYNQVNGVQSSENKRLLTDILRDEWGFKGYVVSDWGAVYHRVKGLMAGFDLEMPASGGENDAEIVRAVKSGELDESVLDTAVERMLTVLSDYLENPEDAVFDKDADHGEARRIACESFVLLKNEGALPLPAGDAAKIAFIGEFAEKPRYQGGGSSHIHSYRVTDALSYSRKYADISFAKGYDNSAENGAPELADEAVKLAAGSDAAVLFIGLPEIIESEGYDRQDMKLPEYQNALVEKCCDVCDNVIIVLQNGAPVEMPWIDRVSAVLETYLGGEAGGEAAADILFGKVNPSGKLAETFPLRIEDNPSYLWFNGHGRFVGDDKKVTYSEGIFVGYRWYDSRKMNVLFPFGHGLSYTQFEYSNITVSSDKFSDDDTLTVTADITNIGSREGKEIVQLYISDKTGMVIRPEKELKGFEKVHLMPNETKTVTFTLDKRSFAYYDTDISDWIIPDGKFEILVARSSADICLKAEITAHSKIRKPFVVDLNTVISEFYGNDEAMKIVMELASRFTGSDGDEAISDEMIRKMLDSSPIRQRKMFAQLSSDEVNDVIARLNDIYKGYK